MAADNGKKKGEYWMGSLMFRTIVMGRAIDLHRNLANSLFPDRLSPEQLRRGCSTATGCSCVMATRNSI
jgi:hypothetical protein